MSHVIGRVYRDSFESGGKTIPTLVMDVRTVSVRKKFTIAVNKLKFPSGKVDGAFADGMEAEADWIIWGNFSGRGESLPSVIVGELRREVSHGGLEYKKGFLFDPFLSPYEIGFALFEDKGETDMLYSIVAEPYRKP